MKKSRVLTFFLAACMILLIACEGTQPEITPETLATAIATPAGVLGSTPTSEAAQAPTPVKSPKPSTATATPTKEPNSTPTPAPILALSPTSAPLLAITPTSRPDLPSTPTSLSEVAAPNGNATPRLHDAEIAPHFEIDAFSNPNYEKGQLVGLAQFSDRIVVLNFWYPSCPPCLAETPELDKAFRRHKTQGVEFVGIQWLELDSVEDGQRFVDQLGVTYALGPDVTGDIIDSYNIRGFPTTFFLDEDHRIFHKWEGEINGEQLEEIMQLMLE